MTNWRSVVDRDAPGLPDAVADELAQHLSDLYDEARRDGQSDEDARTMVAAALAESAANLQGEVETARQSPADIVTRRWRRAEDLTPPEALSGPAALMRGVRFVARDAWRSLRATPAVTGLILAILTLGISAATVTFSVVDAVALRPLKYADPDRLAVLEVRSEGSAIGTVTTAPVFIYEQVRANVAAFEEVAAVRRSVEGLPGGTEGVQAARVTASLFDVLGVPPHVGRAFTIENEIEGNDQVAVLGYELWQRAFGGDPDVVGQTIELTGRRVTVVGVMPPGFSYPIIDDRQPEVWTPFVAPEDERSGSQLSRYLAVVGRLAPDASLDQATTESNALISSLEVGGGHRIDNLRIEVRGLADSLIAPVRTWMMLLLGAVGLVMLVACANVANLLLTRATRRARELAIRASVGASRRRLLLSLLAESLMLSGIAAALGLLVAVWGVDAARAAMPTDIARVNDIALDLRVLAVVVTAATLTGIGFGSVPAWYASRHDLVALIKVGAASATSGRTPWRSAFLTAEIALVAMLLVTTTLFIVSFARVTLADLGFERRELLVARGVGREVPLGDALRALRDAPGIASAAGLANGSAPLALAGGFSGGSSGTAMWLPGGSPRDANVLPLFIRVTPGYFETTGMRLIGGRGFAETEYGRSDLVVLDQPTARLLFGDADPVGELVVYGGGDEARVIGLVDAVLDRGPESAPTPQIYLTTTLERGHDYVIRTTGDAADGVAVVGAVLNRLRPADAPPVTVRMLDEAFRSITADRRFAAGLMAMFGVLALLIGVAGIYGVMASVVAQRSREFGIRLALGADGRRVVGNVMGWAARHLVVGLAVGLVAAAIASRGFASIFFGVTPGDFSVYAIVGAIGLATGLAAAVLPARRASRVDPLQALRGE